jgi:acyl-CoA reductase-like NAD-dependent aldehyde dehydrogenase
MVAKTPLNPSNYTKIYLNGEYTASKSTETFSLVNPKDDSSVVDGIPTCGAEDIDLAVKYAETAFAEYSKFTAMQRTECFNRLAVLMEEQLVDILTLDSLSSGMPTSLIPTREKNYIKNSILYYAGWTDKQKGTPFPPPPSTTSMPQPNPTPKATTSPPTTAS